MSSTVCEEIHRLIEEVQVLGKDLVDKVKTLVHEGNVNRIIIKDDQGRTYLEIPVNVAAVGVVAAPLLAALGALSALVARFTIVVERAEPKPEQPSAKAAPPPETAEGEAPASPS